MRSLNSRMESVDLRRGSDFKEWGLPKSWVDPQSYLQIYSCITSEMRSISSWMRVFFFIRFKDFSLNFDMTNYSRIFPWKDMTLFKDTSLDFIILVPYFQGSPWVCASPSIYTYLVYVYLLVYYTYITTCWFLQTMTFVWCMTTCGIFPWIFSWLPTWMASAIHLIRYCKSLSILRMVNTVS